MKKIIFLLMFILAISYVYSQTAEIQTGGQFKVMGVKEVTSTNPFITPDENMRFIAFDILIDNIKGKNNVKLNLFFGFN